MEWKEVIMENIITDISMGPFGSDIKRDCYVSEGVPYLNGSNVKGFKLGEDSFIYVSQEKADKLKKSIAHRGDLILTHRGTIGQIVYVPETSKYEEYLISNSQFRVTINKNIANPEYLSYYFHSREGQSKILANASQVGVPALGRPTSTFRKIHFKIPSLDTQRRIAAILSSLDRKIELNNKINAQLEEMAQTLFKHWFVDFGPFKNGKFIESELGMIPEGWKVLRSDEIYEINIGKTPPRKEHEWFSKDIKDNIWVSISDLGSCGMFISNSSEYLTSDAIDKHNIILVPQNTVLLSFKLTVGRVAIADETLTTNEAIARFILPRSFHLEFLYFYLKLYDYNKLGSTSSIATAVNSKVIKGMKILKPSDMALKSFNSKVNPLFERIRSILRENQNLSRLRDTLLPKLMSGEISLSEYDR